MQAIYRVRMQFANEPTIILDYLSFIAADNALVTNGYEHFHTVENTEWYRRGESTIATIERQ